MKAKYINQRDRFLKQLKRETAVFSLESALVLCSRIHEAEHLGYELSNKEDKLWEKLTDLIEQCPVQVPTNYTGPKSRAK